MFLMLQYASTSLAELTILKNFLKKMGTILLKLLKQQVRPHAHIPSSSSQISKHLLGGE